MLTDIGRSYNVSHSTISRLQAGSLLLAEAERRLRSMREPSGIKNKGFLRQFDEPAVLQRLHDLPD
jgi:hypothetical protein